MIPFLIVLHLIVLYISNNPSNLFAARRKLSAHGTKSPSLAHNILPTRSPVTMATNQPKPSSPRYQLKTSSPGNGNLLMKSPSPLMMTSLRATNQVQEAEFALRQAAEMQRHHVAREKEKEQIRQLAASMMTGRNMLNQHNSQMLNQQNSQMLSQQNSQMLSQQNSQMLSQQNSQMLSQQERRSSSTSSLGVSRVPQASYAQSDESKLREKMYKKLIFVILL